MNVRRERIATFIVVIVYIIPLFMLPYWSVDSKLLYLLIQLIFVPLSMILESVAIEQVFKEGRRFLRFIESIWPLLFILLFYSIVNIGEILAGIQSPFYVLSPVLWFSAWLIISAWFMGAVFARQIYYMRHIQRKTEPD